MTEPLLSFGIVSDCQYADADAATVDVLGDGSVIFHCDYRQGKPKLQAAIAYFNTQELAFVVHLGDFVDRNSQDVALLTAIIVQSRAPFWHVLGNHDYSSFGGRSDRLLPAYGMSHPCYSRTLSGYRFIVVDSNEVGVIANPPGTPAWRAGRALISDLRARNAINAYDFNGAVSPSQLAWVAGQLDAAQQARERAIIFAHHPIFPAGPFNMLNDSELLSLIAQHPAVLAFFNGHDHRGGFGSRNGVPYFTMAGMQEAGESSYAVAHLYETELVLSGHGRQASFQCDLRA